MSQFLDNRDLVPQEQHVHGLLILIVFLDPGGINSHTGHLALDQPAGRLHGEIGSIILEVRHAVHPVEPRVEQDDVPRSHIGTRCLHFGPFDGFTCLLGTEIQHHCISHHLLQAKTRDICPTLDMMIGSFHVRTKVAADLPFLQDIPIFLG